MSSGAVEFSFGVYISIGFGCECIAYGVRFASGKHPWLGSHKYHRHMSYTVYPQKFKHFNASETHQIKKFSRNAALKRNASRPHVLCNDLTP